MWMFLLNLGADIMYEVKEYLKGILYHTMNITGLYVTVFVTGLNRLFNYISENID